MYTCWVNAPLSTDEQRTGIEARPRTTKDGKASKIPWVPLLFLIPALGGLALIFTLVIPLLGRTPASVENDPLSSSEAALEAAALLDRTLNPETGPTVPENPDPADPGSVTPGGAAVSKAQSIRTTMSADELRAEAAKLGPDSPRVANTPSKGGFWIDAPPAVVAEYLLGVMSDEEILSQLLMMGWPSEDASGPIMSWIGGHNVGGVKIFGWNGNRVDTLARTLGTMQDSALSTAQGIPLLTATDQEGGWVRHIRDTTSLTPGNMAIGASGLAWDAYESSRRIALELRQIGVNMNFAPTVDVYVNPEAHVIGPRSYGSDPVEVGLMSLAALRGMADTGVIATAKHFPGHGNASGDSHGMMPVLPDTMDTLWNRDLLPYRMLIGEGLPSIMVGHLAFPKIDAEGRPATLSQSLNHKLLRENLHFQGLVITDDLYMGGAWEFGSKKGWRLSDIVVEAFRSGNDMVMLSRTPDLADEMWNRLLREYRSDASFKAQLRESARRVLLVKLSYLKPENRVPLHPDPNAAAAQMPSAGNEDYFREQAARAITIVRGEDLPLKDFAGKRIAIAGQDRDFLRLGQKNLPVSESYFFNYEPFYSAEASVVADLKALAARSDILIFSLANPNSLEVLRNLEPWKSKIYVMSTLTPIYFEKLPWVRNAVAIYGWGADSFLYGYEALLGRYKASGSLPVKLD